jgi:hypothetical protein
MIMSKSVAISVAACVAADRTAMSQSGSTGGTLGKTDKAASGGAESAGPSRSKLRSGIGRSGITVVSGTYGGNCGAPHHNATRHLAQECNGKRHCDYVIDYQAIGDPKPMCGKDYVAEWRCGNGQIRSASVQGEAGYRSTIAISCE